MTYKTFVTAVALLVGLFLNQPASQAAVASSVTHHEQFSSPFSIYGTGWQTIFSSSDSYTYPGNASAGTFLLTMSISMYVNTPTVVWLAPFNSAGYIIGPAIPYFFNQTNTHQQINYTSIISLPQYGHVRPRVFQGYPYGTLYMDQNDQVNTTLVQLTP